jgi:Enolase C-terminal domain-like
MQQSPFDVGPVIFGSCALRPRAMKLLINLAATAALPLLLSAFATHVFVQDGAGKPAEALKIADPELIQAAPKWCGGISELLRIGTLARLYDVPVIPRGHSIHASLRAILRQFPIAAFLVIKMLSYYHFEAEPPMPQCAHFALHTGTGFSITLDESKVESR